MLCYFLLYYAIFFIWSIFKSSYLSHLYYVIWLYSLSYYVIHLHPMLSYLIYLFYQIYLSLLASCNAMMLCYVMLCNAIFYLVYLSICAISPYWYFFSHLWELSYSMSRWCHFAFHRISFNQATTQINLVRRTVQFKPMRTNIHRERLQSLHSYSLPLKRIFVATGNPASPFTVTIEEYRLYCFLIGLPSVGVALFNSY